MWNLVYQALHLIARVLTLLITGFIVYLSLKLIYNYFLHPLRSYPGPILVSHHYQGFLSILQRTFEGIIYVPRSLGGCSPPEMDLRSSLHPSSRINDY